MSHVYIHIVSRIIYSAFSAWYGKAIDIPCIRCSVKYFFSHKKNWLICDRERVKVSAQFAIICFIKQFR